MRLGLIGLGRIGAFHADTLSHLDDVDSLVVTDAVPAVTASVAERFGAEAATSPEALIASGVDGIVIAAATDAHTDLIRAGVDAGIPVFCEKPLSGLVEEAVAIAAYVNGSGVPVQIGYPRRFDPAYLAARNAVVDGELGWVHTVRSTTLDPAPPPRGYVAVSGGIFRDCSVHDFDTVRWVTGREVVEVYATGSARGDAFFAELGDVATAQTLLTFDDGATAVVSNSRYNPSGHDVRMELHGTAGSVAAGWSDNTPTAQPRARRELAEREALDVLHGPSGRRVRRRADRVHPGRRRAPTQPLHRRRRARRDVDGRGSHPLPATAPSGADRRGADMTVAPTLRTGPDHMATSTTSRTTGWLSAADCSIDDFTAWSASRPTWRTSRTPTPSSATCSSTARSSARTRFGRRADRGADRADPGPDRRTRDRGVQARLQRRLGGRPRHRGLPRPDRRARRPPAPLPETTSPSPARTTGSGAPWTSWPSPTPSCSRTTTPTT